MIISYCGLGMRHSSHYSFLIHRFSTKNQLITKKTSQQQIVVMNTRVPLMSCVLDSEDFPELNRPPCAFIVRATVVRYEKTSNERFTDNFSNRSMRACS